MGGNNHNHHQLRFLGVLKQPNPSSNSNDDEFTEDDVVWSFFEPYPIPKSPSPSPPLRRFNSGLSAALDNDRLSNRRSILIPGITDNNNHNNNKNNNISNNSNCVGFRQSAPVNVPIWNKKVFTRRFSGDDLDEVEDEDGGEMVPPHVIVARSHVTLSVFEGVGRTLKGRDARRVRNAVFQKTGFID